MNATRSENGQTPLVLIHRAWISARSWNNYVDYFGKRGFAVSAPEWPRKQCRGAARDRGRGGRPGRT